MGKWCVVLLNIRFASKEKICVVLILACIWAVSSSLPWNTRRVLKKEGKHLDLNLHLSNLYQ